MADQPATAANEVLPGPAMQATGKQEDWEPFILYQIPTCINDTTTLQITSSGSLMGSDIILKHFQGCQPRGRAQRILSIVLHTEDDSDSTREIP